MNSRVNIDSVGRFATVLARFRYVFLAVVLQFMTVEAHAVPALRLAVLGDSDSHSYGDSIHIADGGVERGGIWRKQTLQWTEALDRLRGQQIDLGPWGQWGSRGALAQARRYLGLVGRAPRKEDFENNYAVSGAVCADLMHGRWQQAPALAARIAAEPAQWAQAVVVIRIGVNSFGLLDDLQALAQGDPQGRVGQKIDACVNEIDGAIGRLRRAQPALRFVLVGVFDNSNWPPAFDRWHDSTALDRIARGLDRFDRALRARAAADNRVAFFDDRAWFKARWDARNAQGVPAYRAPLVAGTQLSVSNTMGDSPGHAVLADGHAGTAWNLWWAQALVTLLQERFGVSVAPVTDAEIASMVHAVLRSASVEPLDAKRLQP